MTTGSGVPVTEPPQFRAAFKHRKAQIDGFHLRYVVGRHGDPVVLIHGFRPTRYMRRKIMLSLAQGHTVVAPDMGAPVGYCCAGFTGQVNMLADHQAMTGADKYVSIRAFAGVGGLRGAYAHFARAGMRRDDGR
ncbi:hypothetical protein ABZ484_19270 [Streptomyces sp. NPDC006393]|uniref:alpha/beta fold hydrolase n=1 Tax=Streptomyces sp. NPDC006393 TaxID=3156763 RepID=UPI00340729C9